MEKIRVNMAPCEEVKTIHASQSDNATRKWAFDLYDENGKIDSSEIKEQMIFDSRVGGTEQILPENGSDPTTSPIIADIQYPDSLRSEQTFLYRESTTTVNGQAKITHIKGNTLVWNQLVENGDFATSSGWGARQSTISISGGIATVTPSSDGTQRGLRGTVNITAKSGHKYFACVLVKSPIDATVSISLGGANPKVLQSVSANVWTRVYGILDYSNGITNSFYSLIEATLTTSQSIQYKYAMFIDLTQMGLDYITSVDQFTSLYPLPYYSYTTGKLLPFVGTELKATGKNQLDSANNEEGGIDSSGAYVSGNTSRRSSVFIKALPNTTYTLSCNQNYAVRLYQYDGSMNFVSPRSEGYKSVSITTFSNCQYLKWVVYGYGAVLTDDIIKSINLQLEIGTSASSYEPYTSSTINLPTLDYFPTGMKAVGSYDEITENKATQRIGEIVVDGNDIGISSASSSSSGNYFVIDHRKYTNVKIDASNITVQCSHTFKPVSFDQRTADNSFDKCYSDSQARIILRNSSANTTLGSTVESANTWLASHPLTIYFELATPIEEEIITASLVTEKGETPLYYDDELIADCNETISSESGIFDAKIKLMTDETVYSQKIQLHVERKP